MTDDEPLRTAATDCVMTVAQPLAVDRTRPAVAVPGA
jgi:hypothetical protein